MELSNGAVKTAFDIQIVGKTSAWEAQDDLEAADREGLQRVEALQLSTLMIETWRSGVRSAMRAASQLPRRGPTVVDIAPVPAY